MVMEKWGSESNLIITEKMAQELNVNDRIMSLLKGKIVVKNDLTLASNDWELKICAYSDQRVGPYEIMSLLERLNEKKQRSTAEPTKKADPKADFYIECAVKIEARIFNNESIVPADINDAAAKPYIEKYQQH